MVLHVVDVPGDHVRLPVHPVGVEGVGERRAEGAAARDAASAGVAGPVHGAVDGVRLAADVLHDVDLAGVGPPAAGAEHPEGRPDALTARDLDPGLESPVRLGEGRRRQQPCRRVLAAPVVALVVGGVVPAGGDDEVALPVVDGVAGAVRVVLPLVVAPTAAADVEPPLVLVDGRAGGGVELVLPADRADGGLGPVGVRREDERRRGRDEGDRQEYEGAEAEAGPGCEHGRLLSVGGGVKAVYQDRERSLKRSMSISVLSVKSVSNITTVRYRPMLTSERRSADPGSHRKIDRWLRGGRHRPVE